MFSKLSFENALIFVNGNKVDCEYILKDKDICTVRFYPASSGFGKALNWIIGGVGTILSFIPGLCIIGWGLLATNAIWAAANGWSKGWGESIADTFASDLSKLSTNSGDVGSTSQVPTISGAKNQSGKDQPIPLIIGTTYLAPMYIGNPYTYLDPTKLNDGEEEFFNALFILGQKDLDVRQIQLGIYGLSTNEKYVYKDSTLTPLANFEKAYDRYIEPNVTDGYLTIDGNGKGVIPYKTETYDTTLELINTERESEIYPQKVVMESYGTQFLHPIGIANEYVLKVLPFSARYPQKVQLEITFSALYSVNDIGHMAGAEIELCFAYSTDGGSSYKPLVQGGLWGNSSDVTITRTYDTPVLYQNNTVSFATYKFHAGKNKNLRYCLQYEFTPAEIYDMCKNGDSTAEFVVFRKTEDRDGSKLVTTCYFTKILTWCFDYDKTFPNGLVTNPTVVPQAPLKERFRNATTRLAFHIKSGDEIQGTLNELNCIVSAKGRTYDSDTESWSDELSVTNNPASMALMVMQSELRGKYKFADSSIDLVSFGKFYKECEKISSYYHASGRSEDPYYSTTVQTIDDVSSFIYCYDDINYNIYNGRRYVVNGILNRQQKTLDVVQSLLTVGNGYLVLNGSKYGVFVDEKQDTPVMVLNNQNVLDANNTKAFTDRIHGYRVTFINGINYYQEDTADCVPSKYRLPYLDSNGLPTSANTGIINPNYVDDYNRNLENIDLLWTVDPKRVYMRAVRKIKELELRPEVWTRKVGIEGNLIDIGSLVELQDDTISVGIGDGAEIIGLGYDADGNISSIKTDGEFDVTDLTQEYAIKITQANGIDKPIVKTYIVTFTRKGTYSDFVLSTPISSTESKLPTTGDIVTFGIYEKETTKALCFGKKDNGDNTYSLSFVPYQDELYDNPESDYIPEFVTNVTAPTQRGVAVPDDYVTYAETVEISSRNGIESTKQYYLLSDQTEGITRETEGWSETPLTVTEEKPYLWTYTKITYNDEREEYTNCSIMGLSIQGIQGIQGEKGDKGDIGETIETLEVFYLTTSMTSNVTKDTEGWSNTPVMVSQQSPYLWQYTHTTYSSGRELITTPVIIGTHSDGSAFAYMEISSFAYSADYNGVIDEIELTSLVHLLKDNEEVPFEFGEITVPDGFEIITVGRSVKIKALAGSSMASQGYIKIPVIFRTIDEEVVISVSDDNEYLLGFDETNLGYYTYNDDPFEYNMYFNYVKSRDGRNGTDGAKGDQGDRGAEYQGALSSSPVYDLVDGDYYFNTTDAYMYEYSNNEWTKVTDYTDKKYTDNMSDLINYLDVITSVASNELVAIVNLWVDNLVAKSALIEKIFAKEITIQEDGTIKTSNWTQNGQTGFCLTADGKADLNEITINGMTFKYYKDFLSLGDGAGPANSTLDSVTSVTSRNNIAIGKNVMQTNYNGTNNTVLGYTAMSHGSYSAYNIALGAKTLGGGNSILTANGTPEYNALNVAIGAEAMRYVSKVGLNVGIGTRALKRLCGSISKYQVTDSGISVGYDYSHSNVAIGHEAMSEVSKGTSNVAIGRETMSAYSDGGSYNVAIGAYTYPVIVGGGYGINLNNTLYYVEFPAGTTQATVYSTLISYFPYNDVGTNEHRVAVMGRYTHEINVLINNNDGNIDFYNANYSNILVCTQNSSATLSVSLELFFMSTIKHMNY